MKPTKAWAVFRKPGEPFIFTVHRTRAGAIVNAVIVFCEASNSEARERARDGEIHAAKLWQRIRLTETQQGDWNDIKKKHGFYVAKINISEASHG